MRRAALLLTLWPVVTLAPPANTGLSGCPGSYASLAVGQIRSAPASTIADPSAAGALDTVILGLDPGICHRMATAAH